MTLAKLTALLAALAMALGAPALAAPPKHHAAAGPNWQAVVTKTADQGYQMGNPAAPVHLVAYLSYTCPHCADFEKEADAPLRIGMIIPGKGTLEVRPFLRNGIDVVASLLATCGPAGKFFGNTQVLLATQNQWLAPMGKLTEAQKGRWESPDFATKMRAIAGDLGLFAIMERRGYTRAELDRCLADKAQADRIASRTQDAAEKEFINGTPGFLINGVTLAGTYTWESLKPQIDARLR